MWMPYTYEEKKRWFEFRIKQAGLKYLDTSCYRLELRMSRLERQWEESGNTHEFRMERMEARHELEMLKIELEDFERRAKSILNPQPR